MIAYGLLKFVFEIDLNFIHIYALLFTIEIAIMLGFGFYQPREEGDYFVQKAKVDLTPWRYSWAASSTLFAAILIVYLIFSPVGLVGGISTLFWPCVIAVMGVNLVFCWWSLRRFEHIRA